MATDYFQAVRRSGPAAAAILAAAPDINLRHDDGQNLLHHAIAYRNRPAALYLIEHGIDVNAQDDNGGTPLHVAAEYHDFDVARQILERAGDLSIVDSHGNTAVWTAAFNARGKYAMVQMFVEFGGAKFGALKNKHGHSPIDFARQISDEQLVRLLGG